MFLLAKHIFSASTYLTHLLDLFRIPLKNTFNTFFQHFIENKLDDILNDEDNIIDVIHALQGMTFKLKERYY